MRIRIYQINMDRDVNNVCFMGFDSLERFQATSIIDSAIYDKVFSGEVECEDLEDVYVKFNLHQPEGYRARSLSVSDIVEVVSETGTSKFHFCDSIGFRTVEFAAAKAQVSERYLELLYSALE